MRDVTELLASNEEKFLPVDVQIEIQEMGIAQQCSKPEGAKLVEAVAAAFEKASLVGCEKISGSMKDKMVIKATTAFVFSLDNSVKPGPYLIYFDVRRSKKSPKATISVRFNKFDYVLLQERIRSIMPVTNLDINDARISLVFNNDEREMITVRPIIGTFVNGEPVDTEGEIKLEPRNVFNLKLGDVKTAFLSKAGWTDAMVIDLEPKSQ